MQDAYAAANRLSKHDGAIFEHQCLSLQMIPDRPRKHDLLQVTAFADEVIYRVAMVYRNHILLDDWSLVKLLSHVVTCCPNDLHAAPVGRVIRPRPWKSRQERVVDVDDACRIAIHEVRRKDLHVAGQHDKIYFVLTKQSALLLFDPGLRLGGYMEVMIVDLVLFGERSQVVVVAHDERDIHLPFSAAVSCEHIVQTVRVLRNEDRHPRRLSGKVKGPVQVERLGHLFLELGFDGCVGHLKAVQIPLHTHKEHPVLFIDMLVDLQNVAVVAGQKVSYLGHQSFAVGAVDKQNRRVVIGCRQRRTGDLLMGCGELPVLTLRCDGRSGRVAIGLSQVNGWAATHPVNDVILSGAPAPK